MVCKSQFQLHVSISKVNSWRSPFYILKYGKISLHVKDNFLPRLNISNSFIYLMNSYLKSEDNLCFRLVLLDYMDHTFTASSQVTQGEGYFFTEVTQIVMAQTIWESDKKFFITKAYDTKRDLDLLGRSTEPIRSGDLNRFMVLCAYCNSMRICFLAHSLICVWSY